MDDNQVSLTNLQTKVLLIVWPRIKYYTRPNCAQLLRHVQKSDPSGKWNYWSRLLYFMRQFSEKGIVIRKRKGNSVIWEPGPMSDYLQERGVLQ